MARARVTPLRLLARFPGSAVILALTLCAFALEHALGGAMDTDVLLRMGALRADRVTERLELWRLVTPTLLHNGALHLFLNAAVFIQLGPMVEAFWGTRRMVLFYVASGVMGWLASAALNPECTAASVGASGAIMGLAGALLGASLFGGEAMQEQLEPLQGPLSRAIGMTLLIGFALWFALPTAIIDNWAHVGGLLAGLLLSAAYPDPLSDPHDRGVGRGRLSFAIAVALGLASIGLAWLDGERAVAARAPEMAEVCAQQVSEDPEDLPAILQMVDAHADAGLDAQGAERLDRALAKLHEPAQVGVISAWLFAEVEDGRPRDVPLAAALARWVALAPDDPTPLNALAWHLVTRRDQESRDAARAEGLARRALDHIEDPDSFEGMGTRAQILDTLAEALYQQRRYGEARSVQQEAVKLATETQSQLPAWLSGTFGVADALPEMRQRLQKIEQASG